MSERSDEPGPRGWGDKRCAVGSWVPDKPLRAFRDDKGGRRSVVLAKPQFAENLRRMLPKPWRVPVHREGRALAVFVPVAYVTVIGAQRGCPNRHIAQTPLREFDDGADVMGDFFVSPTGLKTLLEGASAPVVLDVRKPAARGESGLMLPGAAWHDPAEVARWIGDLAPDRAYVVHCVHGHEVSQVVGQTLRDSGLAARVLAGGFEAWRASGGAVAPASTAVGEQ